MLDITATTEQLGKTAGKDKELKKLTHPKLLGIEKSQSKAQELINEAKAELEYFGDKAIPLINQWFLIVVLGFDLRCLPECNRCNVLSNSTPPTHKMSG